ncbi:hypothetical protein SD71_10990 [Cohnella kolymensis]|uniref:Cytochrome c assembly protein domain-containing protein n=1 Tax=Cohnella kolymensis TaxID=1590652 RepID=A0ABR5A4P3_9BACL|nr:hypothetical protein [Cohnella kolymensis]KIL35902.1 hypothetical protein SD71_10990 [Cohnella kolymensis]
MSAEAAKVSSSRRGGIVWLIVALLVAWEWGADFPVSTTWFAGWLTAGTGWMLVKYVRSVLNFKHAALGILLFAAFTGLAMIFWDTVGNPVWHMQIHPILLCLTISLLLACGVLFLMISMVIPSPLQDGKGWPLAVISRAVSILRNCKPVWAQFAIVASVHLIMIVICYKYGAAVQILAGLAAAYTQLLMTAEMERTIAVTSNNRLSPAHREQTHRVAKLAIFTLHLVVSLFYLVLAFVGEWSWKAQALYPLSWAVGALVAVVCWLVGRIRLLYYVLLFALLVVNAAVLGAIFFVFVL